MRQSIILPIKKETYNIMDRRKALKYMGQALGYYVATPTLIGMVQSCKNDKASEWTPDFLTPDEGEALTKLVDIILPKTDTPSGGGTRKNFYAYQYVYLKIFRTGTRTPPVRMFRNLE